jgi:hypothetical protein
MKKRRERGFFTIDAITTQHKQCTKNEMAWIRKSIDVDEYVQDHRDEGREREKERILSSDINEQTIFIKKRMCMCGSRSHRRCRTEPMNSMRMAEGVR